MDQTKTKALELAVQLYCGLSNKIKNDLAIHATLDEESPSVKKLVLGFADDFFEYIKKQ